MDILSKCSKIEETTYKYFMEEYFIQISFFVNNICLETPLSKQHKKRPQHSRYGLIFYPNASHWGLLFQLFFLPLCTICVPAEQFLSLQALILLSLEKSVSYSNSIITIAYLFLLHAISIY